MNGKDIFTSALIGAVIGGLIMMVFGFSHGQNFGYREGQLDYQRGIIQYELTENGYKEIVNVE